MWMLVGLGNPGRQYENNRHNIGFHVIDELVRRWNLGAYRSRFGGEVTTGLIRRHKVLVLKPMEFMNLSGYAVQRAAGFHDVAPESIIVVHDEIDLDVGRLKLKKGGGHGGHNGLRSIIAQLGSPAFLRVRCGVGKPGPVQGAAAQPNTGGKAAGGDRRVASYVLSDFPSAHKAVADELVGRAADAGEAIVASGIDIAMNEFNRSSEEAP
jgi:peptidyl-tRNA hydrolase, PTH1 family